MGDIEIGVSLIGEQTPPSMICCSFLQKGRPSCMPGIKSRGKIAFMGLSEGYGKFFQRKDIWGQVLNYQFFSPYSE